MHPSILRQISQALDFDFIIFLPGQESIATWKQEALNKVDELQVPLMEQAATYAHQGWEQKGYDPELKKKELYASKQSLTSVFSSDSFFDTAK